MRETAYDEGRHHRGVVHVFHLPITSLFEISQGGIRNPHQSQLDASGSLAYPNGPSLSPSSKYDGACCSVESNAYILMADRVCKGPHELCGDILYNIRGNLRRTFPFIERPGNVFFLLADKRKISSSVFFEQSACVSPTEVSPAAVTGRGARSSLRFRPGSLTVGQDDVTEGVFHRGGNFGFFC